MRKEKLLEFNPDTAPAILIEEVLCLLYLSQEYYHQGIQNLAQNLDPNGAVVMCNLKGAKQIVKDLRTEWSNQGKKLQTTIFHQVEYKSSNTDATSGHITVITPIDKHLVQDRRVIVVDDIGDTNESMRAIVEDLKATSCTTIQTAVLLLKEEHDRQKPLAYNAVGFVVKNHWLGGFKSLDFGTEDVPQDFPRHITPLVVRIDPHNLGQIQEEIRLGKRDLILHQPVVAIP